MDNYTLYRDNTYIFHDENIDLVLDVLNVSLKKDMRDKIKKINDDSIFLVVSWIITRNDGKVILEMEA